MNAVAAARVDVALRVDLNAVGDAGVDEGEDLAVSEHAALLVDVELVAADESYDHAAEAVKEHAYMVAGSVWLTP